MRTITLNAAQQRQVEILTRLVADRLTLAQAAELLGRSPKQVRRLRERLVAEGPATVVHGNRGRPAPNALAPAVLARIRELASPSGPYADFNVCHLCAVLDEREGIRIGRSTLDRFLKAEHLRRPRRQHPSPLRRRRLRRAAEGALLQVDGSPHAWLEERGPRSCLLGAIDDATGRIVAAEFRPSEDQAGYLRLFRTVCTTYGIPLGVYHDRHTILLSPKRPELDDELAGAPPQSQIQRLLAELGIAAIAAHSPQAKGRIERLWGTLQDRLCKELRLAGVTTLEGANAFLDEYLVQFNRTFTHPPADPEPAWVPLPADCDLAYYFAAREHRVVRADQTVAWFGQTLQLERTRGESNLAGKRVAVHVIPEGEVYLYAGKQQLRYTVVPPTSRRPPRQAPSRPTVPPPPRRSNAGQRRWLYGHP